MYHITGFFVILIHLYHMTYRIIYHKICDMIPNSRCWAAVATPTKLFFCFSFFFCLPRLPHLPLPFLFLFSEASSAGFGLPQSQTHRNQGGKEIHFFSHRNQEGKEIHFFLPKLKSFFFFHLSLSQTLHCFCFMYVPSGGGCG